MLSDGSCLVNESLTLDLSGGEDFDRFSFEGRSLVTEIRTSPSRRSTLGLSAESAEPS